MKRLTILFLAVAGTLGLFAEQHIASQANDVTIFMNGAQVTRSKQVKLNQGKQTIEFTGLSPYIRDNSIQTGVEGKVTILGVKREYDFKEAELQQDKIQQLDEKIKAKELEIDKVKTEQDIIKSEQDFLEANKIISGKNEAVSLQNLQQTLNYYRERLTVTKARQSELALQLKKLNEELSSLKQELQQAKGVTAKKTSKIILEVSAAQAGTYKFNINYYVTNVSWSAAYDLRAFSIGEPIALTYKAQISQNCGEDWKNINLTLSSGNPSQNNVKPTLSTYRLSEPATEITYEDAMPVMLKAEAEPRYKAMASSRASVANVEENMVATEVKTTMNAFEIRIKEKYDIPSTSQPTTVDVGVFELPSKYEYHAVPKKDKDAFLIAQVADWSKHHLISGKANVYFENTYVGQTNINTSSASDTLTFSLGRDKSIVITRDEIDDFAKTKFLSSKVEIAKSWKIDVKNQKQKAVDIIIFDQIPVSGSSSIEINSELDGGELNAKTGEVKWRLNVLPNSSVKKQLTYRVKYPKDWNLKVE